MNQPVEKDLTMPIVDEKMSREVAENAREKDWKSPSFLKELFLGNYQPSLLGPYPLPSHNPTFVEFQDWITDFLKEKVDSAQIDRDGIYPDEVLSGLKEKGAFGMKIPKEYGGLGFSAFEYASIMKLLGRFDSNLAVLLSAHQSIGVPQPLYLFGSDELKKEYLPRCAKGEISAFALTEPEVGSDPARLATHVKDEGDHYLLNGTKLWCTNGTFADLLVVMARHEENNKISAFVVDTKWDGISTLHRCSFMGLKAIQNGVLSFSNVKVPKKNLIGKEGQGLKIALTTLNAGRLALPAGSAGMGKQILAWIREWTNSRVQWGKPIGKHEAVAQRIANMTMDTYIMEAISDVTSALASLPNTDIRLEAAGAKEWNTTTAWNLVDAAIQTRGGRGYENESSLAARGEEPIPLERMMRDIRINRIIEGTTDIMKLYISREFLDTHLRVAGDIIDPKTTKKKKIKALLNSAVFYSKWIPKIVSPHNQLKFVGTPYDSYHRYIEKMSRKLARHTFYGMAWYGAKLEKRQLFLFRLVDIGLELFALSASLQRALEERTCWINDKSHIDFLMKSIYSRTKRRIKQSFRDLWSNDDSLNYKLARKVLKDNYHWVE